MGSGSIRWIRLALAIVVVGAFIYAGGVGISDPLELADNVASFKVLPNFAVVPFALSLTIMTAIFCVAIASALARGLVIDCGCFGSSIPSHERMWIDLGRDTLLLAGTIIIYLLSVQRAEPAEATIPTASPHKSLWSLHCQVASSQPINLIGQAFYCSIYYATFAEASGLYVSSRPEFTTTSKVLRLCSAAATNGLMAPRALIAMPPRLTPTAMA
jgi:putative oxidoreductase